MQYIFFNGIYIFQRNLYFSTEFYIHQRIEIRCYNKTIPTGFITLPQEP